MIDRALAPQVSADLEDKMVLLWGPRQSGKTTLARAVLARASRATAERCLNWDDDEARTRILSGAFPHRGLVVFDEPHQYGRWRNLLKGLYDTHRDALKILVTGSARLDLYRRGGDSTQEYFADGMAGELANGLGKVPGLRVAARTSSFAFTGRQNLDVGEVGDNIGRRRRAPGIGAAGRRADAGERPAARETPLGMGGLPGERGPYNAAQAPALRPPARGVRPRRHDVRLFRRRVVILSWHYD